MLIYSNSASIGASGQKYPVYADYVAKTLKAKLINNGVVESPNRSIIRRSIRDLIEIKEKEQDIIALIGITFLFRNELWSPWIDPINNDGHFFPIRVDHKKIDWSKLAFYTPVKNIHKLADAESRDYYKQWLIHYHPEAELTNLLTDLIMFSGWAETNNIKYRIFSTCEPFPSEDKVGYNAPFINSLKNEILKNKNIINPWEFSFSSDALKRGFVPSDYDKYGRHGHPGKEAHIVFSQILLDSLQSDN